MLQPHRLQRAGCVRNVTTVVNRARNARSYSTRDFGNGPDYNHHNGDSHKHHPEHAHSRTLTGPVPTHPPLDLEASRSASETCQSLVLKRDYESFLTSKFYPRNVQDGFFALKAFYVYTLSFLFPSRKLTCFLVFAVLLD